MDPRQLTLFFADALDRARQSLDVDPSLGEALLQNLKRDLFELTHQALFAQFQLLAPTIGYEEFTASLGFPEVKDHIFRKFPSLKPLMELSIQRFISHAQTFAQDFNGDREHIQDHFFRKDAPLQIHSVRFGLGDSHHFGRSVTLVEFTGGGKLVYKPRSLACDDAFARLLTWFNARSTIYLKIPKSLPGTDHGWVEWIDHENCSDTSGVDRYYQRCGALLSFLHACGATDFHYENLIAHGEYPVPIDLETLFRPGHGLLKDSDLLRDSVLACGLLPQGIASSPGKTFEAGGMSDVEDQPGLWERLILIQDEQGRLQWSQGAGRLPRSHNVPRIQNKKMPLEGPWIDSFINGFGHGYDVFLNHQEEFLELLDSLPDLEVRVLFRNTAAYAAILKTRMHPLVLEHPSGLESFIQKLPALESIRTQEVHDLKRLDVPHFTTHLRSRDLYHDGRVIIPEEFSQSGLDLTRRRVASFDVYDQRNQVRIIENALHHGRMPSSPYASLSLRATAEAIAEWLARQALETGESASWIVQRSVTVDGDKRIPALAPVDLAQGLVGIILFLQEWSHCSDDDRFQPIISRALRACDDFIRSFASQDLSLGLFTGWAGLLMMYNRLFLLTGNGVYYQQMIHILNRVTPLVSQDTQYSVVNGAAGLILACIEVHRTTGHAQALVLAVSAAEHLLKHAMKTEDGLAWSTISSRPLAGLSHGASGFALAFGRLYEATGHAHFAESAKSCLAFERTLFDPQQSNWEDRRDIMQKPTFSTGWSHGAPGIGMVRHALIACGLDSPELKAELDAALDSTVAKGFGRAAHLAMGDFGNMELLLRMSRMTPHLIDQALARVSSIRGPGYLGGLAGVGHQCLRLLYPNLVPSLLLGEVTTAGR